MPMPHYRAYILDVQGLLVGGVNFDCADDAEAIERAEQLDGQHIELWRQVPITESNDAPGLG
jgi:hypothetical protein